MLAIPKLVPAKAGTAFEAATHDSTMPLLEPLGFSKHGLCRNLCRGPSIPHEVAVSSVLLLSRRAVAFLGPAGAESGTRGLWRLGRCGWLEQKLQPAIFCNFFEFFLIFSEICGSVMSVLRRRMYRLLPPASGCCEGAPKEGSGL
jgi:hypothetical protein